MYISSNKNKVKYDAIVYDIENISQTVHNDVNLRQTNIKVTYIQDDSK